MGLGLLKQFLAYCFSSSKCTRKEVKGCLECIRCLNMLLCQIVGRKGMEPTEVEQTRVQQLSFVEGFMKIACPHNDLLKTERTVDVSNSLGQLHQHKGPRYS
ncbi:hypothetical protein E2320_010782 [Naja naja]|nr:hypothetical protein E2320_010782 [Naja naja]